MYLLYVPINIILINYKEFLIRITDSYQLLLAELTYCKQLQY